MKTSGHIRVVFISNRAGRSSGAQCSVECHSDIDVTTDGTMNMSVGTTADNVTTDITMTDNITTDGILMKHLMSVFTIITFIIIAMTKVNAAAWTYAPAIL